MNILIMGAPGAGKGTQAENIVNKYGVVHISTGDIFRSAISNKTKMGLLAQEYINKGSLVPDSVTNGIVKERLSEKDIVKGFLLDGYPRNINQAKELKTILKELNLKVDFVLNIDTPKGILTERIIGRRLCKECGTSYHIEFKPSKVLNVCDKCGGELYQRKDDNLESVAKRLEVYENETKPITNFYEEENLLSSIDGNQKPTAVFEKIKDVLGEI